MAISPRPGTVLASLLGPAKSLKQVRLRQGSEEPEERLGEHHRTRKAVLEEELRRTRGAEGRHWSIYCIQTTIYKPVDEIRHMHQRNLQHTVQEGPHLDFYNSVTM